jgi:hypothetical protein
VKAGKEIGGRERKNSVEETVFKDGGEGRESKNDTQDK